MTVVTSIVVVIIISMLFRQAFEEHQELAQQLVLKNRHLKEIIDQMRNNIWEINTMLAMRN